MKMQSDEYLNFPEEVKEIKDMDCKVVPVDLNGGFVPVDKFGKDNLKETEDSISEKFSL